MNAKTWKTWSLDKSRIYDGLVFATPGERCRYIGTWVRDRPQWLKKNVGSSFSAIADDPEPMCRCNGIAHRAWRTQVRHRFVTYRGSKFSKFSRSSAHSAGIALGGIGARAARRAPSTHIATLETPRVATE